MLNTAVLAPIPNASITIAMTAKLRLLNNVRSA
jgi:hypothetical protein